MADNNNNSNDSRSSNNGPLKKFNVGVIGCGNILKQYVLGCSAFDILKLAACADIDMRKAEAAGKEWEFPKVCTVEELLADPSIDLVINLTVPKSHADVSLSIIAAGKHVYSEKPLGVTRKEGQQILQAAHVKGVRVGGAPDTFLGAGLQTCRRAIDSGAIGLPVAASAAMLGHGPERWHPNPDFYYQPGGGPMLDMGPYYLTALVTLLGPVAHVTAVTHASFAERKAISQGITPHSIKVEVPTHYAGVLELAGGAVATLTTSFDVWTDQSSRFEIYGEEATLRVPDPNTFGGSPQRWNPNTREWEALPLTHRGDVGRGIGVADMAHAIAAGRAHRANSDLTFHVLDVMESFGESSDQHQRVAVRSTVARPAPLPLPKEVTPGQLD